MNRRSFLAGLGVALLLPEPRRVYSFPSVPAWRTIVEVDFTELLGGPLVLTAGESAVVKWNEGPEICLRPSGTTIALAKLREELRRSPVVVLPPGYAVKLIEPPARPSHQLAAEVSNGVRLYPAGTGRERRAS